MCNKNSFKLNKNGKLCCKYNIQFCLVVKDLALRENEMFVEESCHLISC